MTTNGRLSPRQQALLTALLAGERTEQAARTAKISPRTAWRWQKLPAFIDALDKAQQSAFDEKLKLLRSGVGAALNTLLRNMDPKAPPGVQIAAARTWLEAAISVHKMAALETQIREYELRMRFPALELEAEEVISNGYH